MHEESDARLWARAEAGDGTAFGALFQRHRRSVYGYAFRQTADWSAAEEVTAVVFLEAWRRRGEVRFAGETARPWLLGVARNVLRNRWRSRRRHRDALARLGPPPAAPAHDEAVAQRVDDERRMRTVLALVRRLPADQRDALALVVWSGCSYEEAAAALGVPVGTVRSRLARARARLAAWEQEPAPPGGHLLAAPPTREEAQT